MSNEQLNLYVPAATAERFRAIATRLGFGKRPSPLLERLLDAFDRVNRPLSAADARCVYVNALLALPTEAIMAEARQFLVDVGDLVNQSGEPEDAIWKAHAPLEDYVKQAQADLFAPRPNLCPACEHGGVPIGSAHVPGCWLHVPALPTPVLDDPSFGHGR